jgi:hypothetical protein
VSYTLSIGVVGAGYWSYIALIMAICLGRITYSGVHIPLNILFDARKFFNIVLKTKTNDTTFDNPPARACAHNLAWEVLNSCDGLRSKTEKQANNYFQKFAALLEKLSKKRVKKPLSSEELKTAEELQKFFATLYQLGTE